MSKQLLKYIRLRKLKGSPVPDDIITEFNKGNTKPLKQYMSNSAKAGAKTRKVNKERAQMGLPKRTKQTGKHVYDKKLTPEESKGLAFWQEHEKNLRKNSSFIKNAGLVDWGKDFLQDRQEDWEQLKYLARHKKDVYQKGRELGAPRWQLLMHDRTKFLPKNWVPYREYWFGEQGAYTLGDRDKVPEDVKKRFREAVQRHFEAEKHHMHKAPRYESFEDIPLDVRKEMLSDWYSVGSVMAERRGEEELPGIKEWADSIGHTQMYKDAEDKNLTLKVQNIIQDEKSGIGKELYKKYNKLFNKYDKDLSVKNPWEKTLEDLNKDKKLKTLEKELGLNIKLTGTGPSEGTWKFKTSDKPFNKKAVNWFRKHKESGTAKYLPSSGALDLSDVITRSSAEDFNSGISFGKYRSNKEVEEYLNNKFKRDPYSFGVLYEYGSRENIDKSIFKDLDITKNDVDIIKSYIVRSDNRLDKQRTKVFLGNMAGLLGGITMEWGFKKLITEDPEDIENYKKLLLKEKPDLNLKFKRSPMGSAGSSFNYIDNIIRHGDDVDVLAHEVGHARNNALYKKLFGEKGAKIFSTASYSTLDDLIPFFLKPVSSALGPVSNVPILGLAALPFANKQLLDKIDPDKKFTKTIRDNPWTVGAAASAPKLLEEGSASVRALKDIYKLKKSPKAVMRAAGKLLPAFGTYAAASAIPIGLAHMIGKSSEERDKVKKRLTKKA